MYVPNGIIKSIGKYLEKRDIVELSMTCKRIYHIYKDKLWKFRFWNCVEDGEILVYKSIFHDDPELYKLIREFITNNKDSDLVDAFRWDSKKCITYITSMTKLPDINIFSKFVEESTSRELVWSKKSILRAYEVLKYDRSYRFLRKIDAHSFSPRFSSVIIEKYHPEFKTLFMLNFLSSNFTICELDRSVLKLISKWDGFKEIVLTMDGGKKLLECIDKKVEYSGTVKNAKIDIPDEPTSPEYGHLNVIEITYGVPLPKNSQIDLLRCITGESKDIKKYYEEIDELDPIKFAIKLFTKYPDLYPKENKVLKGNANLIVISYHLEGMSKFCYFMDNIKDLWGDNYYIDLLFNLITEKFPKFLPKLRTLCFKCYNRYLLKLLYDNHSFPIFPDDIKRYLNFRDRKHSEDDYDKLKFIKRLSKLKVSNFVDLLVDADTPFLIIKFAIVYGAPISQRLRDMANNHIEGYLGKWNELYNFILNLS